MAEKGLEMSFPSAFETESMAHSRLVSWDILLFKHDSFDFTFNQNDP